MKVFIAIVAGVALTLVGFGGRIAGPYTLVLPPGQDPVVEATAQCQERLTDLALVLTAARHDGTVEVVYRCEQR
jgi:uncharacterized membrane protein YfcA